MEFLALIIVVILIFWITSSMKESNASYAKMDVFLKSTTNCKYKYHYKQSGIGVDTDSRQLHLFSQGLDKIYSFSDVREWKINFSSGGGLVGGGLPSIGANIANDKQNKKETGLFILVRDIENPVWRIEFDYNNNTDKELNKWMEILRQSINES